MKEATNIHPVEAGIRELKNNLSRYLALVSAGDMVIVTDRGRAVARIIPAGIERTMDKLVAQGIVTRASLPKGSPPVKRVNVSEPVSSLVVDQRR
ncbi:MAG: type II toxin-antitoxin system Phd/YefM family antitoxin [Acidimicrobiales bacterium]